MDASSEGRFVIQKAIVPHYFIKMGYLFGSKRKINASCVYIILYY
jgi:hypothetical protein